MAAAADTDKPQAPMVYARRWAVVAVFCLLNSTNAALWVTYAAISTPAGDLFQVDAGLINALSLTYMFAYLPGTLLAAWSLDRLGLRATMAVAGAGNLVCGVVRALAVLLLPGSPMVAWGITLAGQCVGALVQPAFTNAPAKIAGVWFPKQERDLATVLAAMSNPLGNAIGMFLPTLMVSSANAGDMGAMLWTEAGAAALGAVLTLLVIRDAPPTPASLSSGARSALRAQSVRRAATGKGGYFDDEDDSGHSRETASAPPDVAPAALAAGASRGPGDCPGAADSHGATTGLVGAARADAEEGGEEGGGDTLSRMWVECRVLLSDPPFRLLLVAFSLGLGLFNAFVTLVAQIVEPCGYNSDDAGIFGGALIGAGLLGAGVAGAALEATRAYTAALRIGFVLCTATILGLVASLQRDSFGLLVGTFAGAGLTILPLLPVTLESAVEHSFPIVEESASALLLLGGQITGIVFVFVMPLLIPNDCSTVLTPFAALVAAVLIVATALILCFRVQPRRTKAETNAAASPLLAAPADA
ncbi:hypothetical protein FNF27_03167 [Cafeteria roenbergensis]|uniref:Major facilitator superfamily (MFS) profile domain-containing protein n=3 Tax=Cafeteria roenbergensis TaxID=33653 RepID=A0A5A8EFG6_CAFRO|nr:hypothetical protein FNF27_03167 [Cafeteria roenbergensis]